MDVLQWVKTTNMRSQYYEKSIVMGTTTDTYNNLNEPAENYAEWKKANIKRLHIVQFHLQCS